LADNTRSRPNFRIADNTPQQNAARMSEPDRLAQSEKTPSAKPRMPRIESLPKIALFSLVGALPAEAVNFWIFTPPIDVGLPPDAPWYEKLIAFQWVVFHLPGMYLSDWLTGHDGLVIFVCGYLDTAVFLALATILFKWTRHLVKKRLAKSDA